MRSHYSDTELARCDVALEEADTSRGLNSRNVFDHAESIEDFVFVGALLIPF